MSAGIQAARRTSLAVLLAASLFMVAGADSARAHMEEAPAGEPPVTPLGGFSSAEVSALGAEHAADHARRPGPRLFAEPDGGASAPNAFTGGAPDAVGRWTNDYFPLPNYALHAVMLPTGKVLFWGYPPQPEAGGSRPNGGEAALWDPALGTGSESLESVDPPLADPDGPGPLQAIPAPLYCSGQTLLPSGAVLAAGGNVVWPGDDPADAYDDYAGTDFVYTFDPYAERWIAQSRMAGGRWYPSQVRLSDGRTAIMGGFSAQAPGGIYSTSVEIFTPGPGPGDQGTVSSAGGGEAFETALYPHLTELPNGRVLLSGPAQGDYALLDFPAGGEASIEDLPGPPDLVNRVGSNAVAAGGGPGGAWRVTQLGGIDPRYPANPDAPREEFRYDAQPSSVITDGRSGLTARGPTLPSGRSYANTVLLPDGSMIQVGGANGQSPRKSNYDAIEVDKRVQIFNPGTNTWTLGPNQREFRTYHSTAVLLPDGRVFSAGDDYHSVEPIAGSPGSFRPSLTDTAEIYKPAYLFGDGNRPRILQAPRGLGYRDEFGVQTLKGRGAKAVLMAPSATTHGADMGQARIPLRRVPDRGRSGLHFASPPSSRVATPGPYMLFVLSKAGKPSVARWVMLG